MKKPKSTLAKNLNKPRGWIYGARWGGRTIEATVVRVMVGVAPADWWCADMVGQERSAIEVKMDDQTVYIDNADGKALAALLDAIAPLPGTRFMPVFQVLQDGQAEVFYKAKKRDGCL